MTEILRPDLCVLGGGTAGLAAATAAAQLGADVVLVEKWTLGGGFLGQAVAADAFCAAARDVNRAARLGVSADALRIDLKRLRLHLKEIIAHFALEYAPARLAAMNIKVVRAAGSFVSPTRLEAGGFGIEARHFVVATGAPPTLPSIAGIELLHPLSEEELLLGKDLPRALILIGASFDTLCLAQAVLRLGAHVVLIAPDRMLPGEDEELIAPLLDRLAGEGLAIHQNAEILRLEPKRTGLRVILGPDASSIEASHLMVATKPAPCVEGLGLKAARVAYSKEGIETDADGKTASPRIRAVGSVLGGDVSAMAARLQGERAAAALFGEPPEPGAPLARVLATDPEMAVVGLSEAAARAAHKSICVLRAPFSENERARAGFGPHGHVKIMTDSHGLILGAGIIGPQARELIGIFSLAMAKRATVADLEAVASTSPTLAQTCRTAALASAPQLGKAWLRPRLIR
jgi:pyruvate/2-oxoglutarate dehydrogenase complex dihydrolipoamide dehydrogenase (E3) component